MVCIPVISVRPAYLVLSQHAVCCDLTNCFSRDQLVISAYRWWCSWKYKFEAPHNRNPFDCWGWHCVVPGV